MSIFFECAGISYHLSGHVPRHISQDVDHYFTYEASSSNVIIQCHLKYVPELDPVKGTLVYQNPHRLILNDNGRECRIHLQDGMPLSYYKEINDSEIEIQFYSHMPQVIDMAFLEHFALERQLLKLHGIVMHACVIKYQNEAIVFTAPSGTGKSTQGNLWKKYKEAEIINGDRCIVQIREDKVFACGLPFCGSSFDNKNEILPLKGIVVLSQAQNNQIEILDTAHAVKKIMSETSINYWNTSFVTEAISLITEISTKIPIVHLQCTPTMDAVELLHHFLF